MTAAAPGTGSRKAKWQFAGLVPGEYEVLVTWPATARRAPDAPYRVYHGEELLATIRVNQTREPRANSHLRNISFHSLGHRAVGSGKLRVVLGNDADRSVSADAVRVVAAEEDDGSVAETAELNNVVTLR